MNLHGQNRLGDALSARGDELLHAVDPETGGALAPSFHVATRPEIDRAFELAAEAARPLRRLAPGDRAALLEHIATELEALGAPLFERAARETGLPVARLESERGRTASQLRLFADALRAGLGAETAHLAPDPGRQPAPRPELRLSRVALGPVVVFGASNFPLAFSAAGGDTAAALAAGCPVVHKAHPAHPGTCELVGEAIARAVAACGAPAGSFSLLHGGAEVGRALAAHPGARAVAFTGSLGAGRALLDVAAARPDPIPVFAEMGSQNPVFALPAALAARADEIAAGLYQSLTLGVGQFCTNPGLVLCARGAESERLLGDLRTRVSAAEAGTMLSPGIAASYRTAVRALAALPAVEVHGDPEPAGPEDDAPRAAARPALAVTDAGAWLAEPQLSEEVFGPATLVVLAEAPDQLPELAEHLAGQLTATVHADAADRELAERLLPALEEKAGRIVWNGFPTGVEVDAAMNHGGPWPATTDARFTSVGTAAIERFLRPLCVQGRPPA
ncbi:MAG: aldehyde dehydrogenase (NADP(+)) [Planctomycetota bacterium]